MLDVCMYVPMYLLTSIFMQADLHEYVGEYICVHASYVYVCMYICIEVKIHMYVGKHA